MWQEEVVDTEPASHETDEHGDEHVFSPMETVEKTYSIEVFECPVCKLHLYGTKEIAAADMPEDFTETEYREMKFGEEYGND